MNNQIKQNDCWDSKFGFLMAILGASLGLGGIWGFPISGTIKNIGAYLLIYSVSILILGSLFVLCALAVGQNEKLNPLNPARIHNNQWQLISAKICCILSTVVLLLFEAAIGGWTISSVARAITGKFDSSSGIALNNLISYKTEILICSGIFMLIIMTVAYMGINSGVERIDMSTLFWTYLNRTIYLMVYEFIVNNKIAFLALSRVK